MDISAIKQSLQSKEICSVRWYSSLLQLANSLTKHGMQSHILLDMLQSGCLNLERFRGLGSYLIYYFIPTFIARITHTDTHTHTHTHIYIYTKKQHM